MTLLRVSPETREAIEANARKTSIGGVSRIFAGEERQERLWHDQLTGHFGEAAFCRMMTGSVERYKERYREARPRGRGDEGWDLEHEGIKYDVKTSYTKDLYRCAKTHHLIVREQEWHPEVYYVLALTDHHHVLIVGWIKGTFLKEKGNTTAFPGAWALRGCELR